MLKSKKVLSLILTISVVLLLSVSGFALTGGMPAVHGVSGKDFGAAVTELAQTDPEALAAHVSSMSDTTSGDPEAPEPDESDMAGGIPAAHSLAGEDFGEAVSGLAQTDPGALAEHVRSR